VRPRPAGFRATTAFIRRMTAEGHATDDFTLLYNGTLV
jgi:hypothetical protein